MTDSRAAYTSGLRQLADILDANPDLPLPYTGHHTSVDWIPLGDEAVPVARVFSRVIPGVKTKQHRDDLFTFSGSLAGLNVAVLTNRDQVCTRVVTGTETIVCNVPDPELLAKVPMVAETYEVETVRWDCLPLLADAEVSS